MKLYAPLQFVENVKNYLRPAKASEEIFNDITEVEGLEKALYYRYASYTGDNESSDKFENIIDSIRHHISKYYNLNAIHNVESEIIESYLVSAFMASKWRKNKISYKIDKELLSQFYQMDIPKTLAVDFILKQPATTYYLDVSEYGDEILKHLHGIFINTMVVDDFALVRMILYSPNNELGDTIVLHLRVNTSSKELKIPTFKTEKCSDVDAEKLYTLFLNFMIYLHASNKDIEISERTRQNHSKEHHGPIKDKFREVKEFSVGYRYGSEVRKNRVRYKYVGEAADSHNYNHRKVSSHYRAAHWHRYWVGTGDNKELVPKWIEGIFVKGSIESDDVVIHKVK
jgi:hypothetical protein